jgi:hypothetical protein
MAELFSIDGETAASPYGFSSVQIDAGGSFAPDDAAAHTGPHGFKAVNAATDASCGRMNIEGQATLYCRIYVYVPNTFALEAATGRACFIDFANGGSWQAGIRNITGGGTVPDRWYIRVGTTNTDVLFSSVACFDAWHCFELKYLKHASAGGLELYIDGVSVASDLDQATTGDIVQVDIGLAEAGDNSTGYIYVDDIVGADAGPIGVIAAGGGAPKFLSESLGLTGLGGLH